VIFRAIVLRLVAPGMVTVALLTFVGAWNNYFLLLQRFWQGGLTAGAIK
jgi:multiple sugar transport system permease protein